MAVKHVDRGLSLGAAVGTRQLGLHDEAEKLVRSHMSVLKEHNVITFWECIHRGVNERASACHSWSTAPMSYLTRHVLGLRETEPGDPDRLVLDPTTSLDRCEGVYPHPKGPIRVSWHRDGDGIKAHIEAPAGVTVTTH